ncbi:MAG: hypothetical protein ABI680_06300, partial [Chthoniobacteraceae bacterium]
TRTTPSHALFQPSSGNASTRDVGDVEDRPRSCRVATEKMLDYYRRTDIEVTPEMTLAPEKPTSVQSSAR